MNLLILGHKGFIGSNLINSLKNRSKYKIFTLDLRKAVPKKMYLIKEKVKKAQIIINCAASLNPRSQNDIIINTKLPLILEKYANKNTKLIHISTLNVLEKKMNDNYTVSKRNAEKFLKKTTIVRLPLILKIYKDRILNTGNVKYVYQLTNKKYFIIPVIFPGITYYPIEIKKLLTFLKILISSKKKVEIINLSGKKPMTFFEIIENIFNFNNQKYLKLRIPNSIIFLFSKTFFKQNNFLKQLTNYDFIKLKRKSILL